MLNLKRLEHLVVIAQEHSFLKAAQRLHLTPPALTRSIQTLESTLGLALLNRSHEGVSLTDAGELVVQRANRLLGDAQNLKNEADQLRGVQTGQVNFGVGVFPAAAFLTGVLIHQARERPGLKVQVDIGSWQRLLGKLERHELDFVVALTQSLPPPQDFQIQALPSQRFAFFVRTGHPLLAMGAVRQMAAFRTYGLMGPQLPRKARENLCALYGIEDVQALPMALMCDEIHVLQAVVAASDHVLLATHEGMHNCLTQGRVQVLRHVQYAQAQPVGISVVHHRQRSLSPAAAWFVELIGQSLSGQWPPEG